MIAQTLPSYDFTGKTAVVTGGTKGIGAGIAWRLHAAGAAVTIWGLEEPGSLLPGQSFRRVDVSDQEAVSAAASIFLEQHGKLDILSHNAGYSGSTLPVAETDPGDWSRVVDVNLAGTYRVCQALLPALLQSENGRVVNMASLAGKEGTPNASAYSASKAGVIAFTKSFAKEVAHMPIRVNCVAPAAVKTEILDQMTPEFVRTMIDKSPLKRLGTIEEVAELVLWLSSDACSFNTGAVFDLSGGRAVY